MDPIIWSKIRDEALRIASLRYREPEPKIIVDPSMQLCPPYYFVKSASVKMQKIITDRNLDQEIKEMKAYLADGEYYWKQYLKREYAKEGWGFLYDG